MQVGTVPYGGDQARRVTGVKLKIKMQYYALP